jgi:phosphoglycolate phosphatase
MKSLLEHFVGRGVSQFILSALPQVYLDAAIERYELEDVFAGIYGLSHGKADCKLERGRDLLRVHGIDCTSCILVGDTAHDFEVAQDLGVDILLVADGHQSFERLSRLTNRVLPSRYAERQNDIQHNFSGASKRH